MSRPRCEVYRGTAIRFVKVLGGRQQEDQEVWRFRWEEASGCFRVWVTRCCFSGLWERRVASLSLGRRPTVCPSPLEYSSKNIHYTPQISCADFGGLEWGQGKRMVG